MKTISKMAALALAGFSFSLVGCGHNTGTTDGGVTPDNVEMANSVGDTMASLDETNSGGEFAALNRPVLHERQKPGAAHWLSEAILPSAHAAGCWTERFSACANGARERDFDGCTEGLSSFQGSTTLTFSDAGCDMSTDGDSVTRSANFTLAGPEGSTYTVSSPDGGQTVTRNAQGFSYEVHGLRRVATNSASDTLFDISTDTTTPFTVTGSTRATRVVDGGALVITNNLKGYVATLSASQLAWSASCNCPVSGVLTGTLTGSEKGAATLTLTGCGTATLKVDAVTESVTFDRCGAI